MKRSRLKPISKRKLQQYKEELADRKSLCLRAGGEWISVKSSLVGGYCKGGLCEICGLPASHSNNWTSGFRLEPHEDKHRGISGKLSLENSKMCCRPCHDKEHHK